ncbi:hypothetical protein C8R45DRAFT_911003 [Mycena sanguinolenta]|nr:hypothetical protein C8R45DRAFT_911003 [Mycena sanguinolenta]
MTMFLSYPPGTLKFWLAQANCIFTRVQATSHLGNYVCPFGVAFRLDVNLRCRTHSNRPEPYLFVCPPENFRAGGNSFRWPDCPAYWSLDPSGADRLSPEAAKTLGFPKISIQTGLYGTWWDNSVYKGLRRFHQGKGFDPDSQDLARHLDYPLFGLSSDKTTPLEYGEPNSLSFNLFHFCGWSSRCNDPRFVGQLVNQGPVRSG